ncbi:hypothetical protein ACHAXH_000984, partial [Discostella pseudostelligera]
PRLSFRFRRQQGEVSSSPTLITIHSKQQQFTLSTMAKKTQKQEELTLSKKDQKKVDKLNAQIPYHEGRGNKDEVGKIKEQIDAIWEKAREAQFA